MGRTNLFRFNDPVQAAKMRKDGDFCQLNLTRMSLMTWSSPDLLQSSDFTSSMYVSKADYVSMANYVLIANYKILITYYILKIINFNSCELNNIKIIWYPFRGFFTSTHPQVPWTGYR
jgi:hypothetical protein